MTRAAVPMRAIAALALTAALAPLAAAQTAGCSLQFAGASPQSFDRCLAIDGVGDGFVLYWTQGANSVTWGMSTSSSSGYVAFGFPESPGQMVGANAFALQACASCATGAQLRQWYLGGTASGEMQLVDNVPFLSGPSAGALPGGGMGATFTLPAQPNLTALPLIFAAGAVYNDGGMRQHGQYGSGTLNLATGAISDTDTSNDPISSLVAAHLWLLLLGWGVFIPLGVAIARCMRERDPLWFHLHRAVQCLGLLMGIVGLALGFVISGGWSGRFPVHRNLGLAATILGLLPALRWRPKLTSPYRRLFNIFHWYVGRSALILAVANIYYGLIAVLDVSAGAWAAFTAVLGVIVGAAVLKESYDYCQLPPPGSAINSKRGTAGPATNGNQDGVHNGAGLSDVQTTSQLQEVALTDKPAA